MALYISLSLFRENFTSASFLLQSFFGGWAFKIASKYPLIACSSFFCIMVPQTPERIVENRGAFRMNNMIYGRDFLVGSEIRHIV